MIIKSKGKNNRSKKALNIGFILVVFIILISVINALRSSLFFQTKDRINLVFYQKIPVLYSLGLVDNVNYSIVFYPDLQMLVPGGYGKYRVGAFGKLVSLEKDPEIFKRTFSLATSSFVNFYFYPKSPDIYFGKGSENGLKLPTLSQIFLENSNVNFFDRVYIFLLFWGKTTGSFQIINQLPIVNGEQFDATEFANRYTGYFYRRTYRTESQNVQILYTNDYNTAESLSNILEGNGIRVGDVSQQDSGSSGCEVLENSQNFSKTASDLNRFFDCPLKPGDTGAYDIILKLGSLEKTWKLQ